MAFGQVVAVMLILPTVIPLKSVFLTLDITSTILMLDFQICHTPAGVKVACERSGIRD